MARARNAGLDLPLTFPADCEGVARKYSWRPGRAIPNLGRLPSGSPVAWHSL